MPKKSRPDDVRLACDEAADPIDREAAIKRLGADHDPRLEPLIAPLRRSADPRVRAAAYCVLIVYWRRPDAVDDAIRELFRDAYDDDESFARMIDVRRDVGGQLGIYAGRAASDDARRICEALARVLTTEDDHEVHAAAYEALLRVREPFAELPRTPRPFEARRHVDWSRVAEILQQPQRGPRRVEPTER